MGQFYDHIPAYLIPWIEKQKLLWIATAPLAKDGHVNVSPKGYPDKCFHIVRDEPKSAELEGGKGPGSRTVWYEDLTGSAAETISHLRENGRITILFSAFEGPPRIVRLFGTGKVYEFGTPEYNAILPPEKRQPSSRAVIWIDVHKVGTSCGYAVPFFTYKAERLKHRQTSFQVEQIDHDAFDDLLTCASMEENLPKDGARNYWKVHNLKSLDGLPGLLGAHISKERPQDWRNRASELKMKDDESESKLSIPARLIGKGGVRPEHVGFAFAVGTIAGILVSQWYMHSLSFL